MAIVSSAQGLFRTVRQPHPASPGGYGRSSKMINEQKIRVSILVVAVIIVFVPVAGMFLRPDNIAAFVTVFIGGRLVTK
jgi:hypothetical protein